MKLKFTNKYKGFTLSELMIMLAVFTVLLAAFAPVFTVRYNNASSEEVWSFVPDDEEMDAYTDQISKVQPAQLFVGITPANKTEVVSKAVANGADTLYSKLVIRPTDKFRNNELQKQIQFRYGDLANTGTSVGTIFAGNENILFGGDYSKISFIAHNNTAYGSGALNSLFGGNGNSALGYKALTSLTHGYYNTAIGAFAGEDIKSQIGNTLIGYKAFSSSDYVTAISDDMGNNPTKIGDYSTFIGSGLSSGLNIGQENTIVGSNAGVKLGDKNTAIGAYALSSSGAGNLNTAIGYNACAGVTGSNKTCIGANSGTRFRGSGNGPLLSDNNERVFIGQLPINETATGASSLGGAAVLEVHNIDGTYRHNQFSDSGRNLTYNWGNSSVVVNGNLIVRGQSFFSGGTYRRPGKHDLFIAQPSLMGFRIVRDRNMLQSSRTFSGDDGEERTIRISDNCSRRCRTHKYSSGSQNCICAKGVNSTVGVTSYDWTTNVARPGGCISKAWRAELDAICYNDKSNGTRICDSYNEFNNAHTNGAGSCCPDLRSDIRLKNVSGKFTGGLDEIRKLMVYNYTYKSDEEKNPHVGVIAQDLKRIFPTAVRKDENGYYQIRWDEMLYAAINAIKTLNTRVEELVSRVAKDQDRIANLKKDNAELEKQLDTLSAELSTLEKKHK